MASSGSKVAADSSCSAGISLWLRRLYQAKGRKPIEVAPRINLHHVRTSCANLAFHSCMLQALPQPALTHVALASGSIITQLESFARSGKAFVKYLSDSIFVSTGTLMTNILGQHLQLLNELTRLIALRLLARSIILYGLACGASLRCSNCLVNCLCGSLWRASLKLVAGIAREPQTRSNEKKRDNIY